MPFFGGSPPGPPPSAQLYHYVGTNILGGTNALNVSTGQNNIALGTGAQQDLLNGDLNVVIGLNAGQNFDGPNPTTTQRSIAIGNTVGFTDGVSDSVVVGTFAFAQSNSSVVIGAHSVSAVGGDFSVTLGYNSIAGIRCVSIGNIADGSADGTVTIGNGAHNSTGDDSIAIGTLAGDAGIAHIALGHSAKATANYAIAVGSGTKSHSLNAICAGQGAYVSGPTDGADGDAQGGIAIGVNAKSLNTVADTGAGVAIGMGAYADNLSVALGRNALTNDGGIALGESASNGAFTHSIAIGQGDTNTANDQIIIGDNTYTDITIGGYAFPGAGGVTTISVVTANGFAGTVANPTTTPAVTIKTGVTGILLGNGTGIAAAAGSDLPAMTATVAGAVPTPPNDATQFLNGTGAFSVPLPVPVTDLTAPATGFTYTVPNGTASALINPAGTLATGTINMPAVPTDGQKLTIASSQQITALTMSGNGKTLLGALVTIGANGFATWQYRASITTWFRVG